MTTQQVAHPQTVTKQMRTKGTRKQAQVVVKTLPDGRVRASIRVSGSNVVQARVGEVAAVMSWLSARVEKEDA